MIGLVTNYVSRKNEFEADKFVYDNYEPGSLPALEKAGCKESVKHDSASGICLFPLFTSSAACKTGKIGMNFYICIGFCLLSSVGRAAHS